jgi:hypothetical protein
MQTSTTVDSRVFISDGCNSFVYYGGIFDILFLSLFLLAAGAFVFAWCKFWRDNKKKNGRQNSAPPGTANQLRNQVVKNNHVEVHVSEPGEVPLHTGINAATAPTSEGLQLSSFSHSSCSHSSAGFVLSGAGIESVNGVYAPPSFPPPPPLSTASLACLLCRIVVLSSLCSSAATNAIPSARAPALQFSRNHASRLLKFT